jgi:TetR/AcrR family transcriptional repressor of nem operon
MKTSRAQVAENRSRILTEAGRLFRERGFDGVSVSDIMLAAGLTHGAFYGYFASKDELIAQTMRTLLEPPAETFDLAAYLKLYLSPVHRDGPADGCPVAALGGEASRQCEAVKAEMTRGLEAQLKRIGDTRTGRAAQRREEAIVTWATMLGAMILSRAIGDPDLSAEVLATTRRKLAASA